MKKIMLLSLLFAAFNCTVQAQLEGSLWDVPGILDTPVFTKEYRDSVYEIIYTGLAYKGVPKKTFAYYATPGSLSGRKDAPGSLPAVVLVHGGGGTAFIGWVKEWARRGYAAIAMDGRGNRPDGTHIPDGFQETASGTPIYTITSTLQDQWMFQAVADIIIAHNLVRSFPEVDTAKTALAGISWGGVLTLITAGVDHRFKAAAPIYGCGFFPTSPALGQGLNALSAADRDTWLRQYDPAHYVARAPMPILFVNGVNDPAFYLDSYIKTYELAANKQLSLQIGLKHGHYTEGMGYEIKEHYYFIDHYLRNRPGLALFAREEQRKNGRLLVKLKCETPIEAAWLHYTTDTTSNLLERKWQRREVQYAHGRVYAGKPPSDAVMWYISVTDIRGVQSSGRIHQ